MAAFRRASAKIIFPLLRSDREFTMTAARMTAPEIAVCQNRGDVDDRQSVDDHAEKQRTEQRAGTEPTPPAIETPPMTQAAITVNS